GGIGVGALSRAFDTHFIDGLIVNGSAKVVGTVAAVVRRAQSGFLSHYAFVMILGLIVLLAVLIKLCALSLASTDHNVTKRHEELAPAKSPGMAPELAWLRIAAARLRRGADGALGGPGVRHSPASGVGAAIPFLLLRQQRHAVRR